MLAAENGPIKRVPFLDGFDSADRRSRWPSNLLLQLPYNDAELAAARAVANRFDPR
jgi:hypothetical protein